mmetsp:Transcript_4032/g.11554  ORF Transcript_4032/g.11554 Transcript_4032/m.11554 type:complete len:264 (-) Transcript_4032:180-971(-)
MTVKFLELDPVSGLLPVVELLKQGRCPLVNEQREVGIELAPFPYLFGQPPQHKRVQRDGRGHARPLDLDCHRFVRVSQNPLIHLAKGSRCNGRGRNLPEHALIRSTVLLLDHSKGVFGRKRRELVLQLFKLCQHFWRQHVRSTGDRLSNFDVGRSKPGQNLIQPPRPSLWIRRYPRGPRCQSPGEPYPQGGPDLGQPRGHRHWTRLPVVCVLLMRVSTRNEAHHLLIQVRSGLPSNGGGRQVHSGPPKSVERNVSREGPPAGT